MFFVPPTLDGHCSIGARLLAVLSTIDGGWYSFVGILLTVPTSLDGFD